MKILHNPITYLLAKTWEYSLGNRKKVILFASFFVAANILPLIETLVVAQIFNVIQRSGISSENLAEITGWLFLLLGFTLMYWLFHGPARVWENENAFLLKRNYKKFLLDGVLALPMEWHVNHHSGDTIDKI